MHYLRNTNTEMQSISLLFSTPYTKFLRVFLV